jgi:hypothetical protein
MRGPALLLEVSRALSLNQRQLGALVGVSSRTVQRWHRGGSPAATHWHALARATHATDADLAARAAAEGHRSLEELGLVAPAPVPPPAPPPAPRYDVQHLADAVVCAAAEAIDVTPGAVRPALLAAVRRAKHMHLTLEDLEASLGAAKPRRRGASSATAHELPGNASR